MAVLLKTTESFAFKGMSYVFNGQVGSMGGERDSRVTYEMGLKGKSEDLEQLKALLSDSIRGKGLEAVGQVMVGYNNGSVTVTQRVRSGTRGIV